MKRLVLILFLFGLMDAPLALAGPDLVVGQPGSSCVGAQYRTINDAIAAAAPGATILVCPGIYAEQPQISKPLTLRLDRNAVLRPNGMISNGFSLSSGNPFAALLLVANTTNVEIVGGQYDGSLSDITLCSPRLFGIVFQNASGGVSNTSIYNISLAENLNGCQSGTSILVQSGNGGTSRVEVASNKVWNYQKNGMTFDGMGTYVNAHDNSAIGVGPTTGAAQNGFQMGFGATGILKDNNASNHQWAPCVSASQCEFFATGFLLVETSEAKLFRNQSGQNQVNLFLDGSGHTAMHNSFLNALIDGLEIPCDNCKVDHNLIAGAGRAGAYVTGNNDELEHDTFVEMPIAILKLAGVIGLDHEGNHYIDVPQDFVDPPSTSGPVPQPDQP